MFLSGYPDFSDYYIGAGKVLVRINPYLPDTRYFTQQVYPPFALIAFLPLLLAPYVIAAKIWVVFSIVAVILSIYFTSNVYGIAFRSPVNLLLAGFIFLSFPLKFTLGMGQINTFILLLMTISFYYLNKKKEYISGIYFAIPFLLKFFAVFLIPYFVFLKKWKLLISFLLTILITTMIVLVFIPFPIFMHYYQFILPNLVSSWKGDYYNQALSGFLLRSIPDAFVRQYLRIILSFIFIFITAFSLYQSKSRSQKRINLEIAAIIVLSVLINNFSWQHHFVFLILPFLIIVYTLITTKYKQKVKNKVFLFLLLSYILIAINLANPFSVPVILRSHVFYGGVLLWIITVYILFRFKIE